MGLAGGVAFILVFLLIFLPLADFKVAKECCIILQYDILLFAMDSRFDAKLSMHVWN